MKLLQISKVISILIRKSSISIYSNIDKKNKNLAISIYKREDKVGSDMNTRLNVFKKSITNKRINTSLYIYICLVDQTKFLDV